MIQTLRTHFKKYLHGLEKNGLSNLLSEDAYGIIHVMKAYQKVIKLPRSLA